MRENAQRFNSIKETSILIFLYFAYLLLIYFCLNPLRYPKHKIPLQYIQNLQRAHMLGNELRVKNKRKSISKIMGKIGWAQDSSAIWDRRTQLLEQEETAGQTTKKKQSWRKTKRGCLGLLLLPSP